MTDNIWEMKALSIFDDKPETNRQFKYFQQYLLQGHDRSVKRLHKDLLKTNKKSNIKIPKYETLRNYCHKFNWVKRAEAYDQYQLDLVKSITEEANLRASCSVSQFYNKEISRCTDRVGYSTKALSDAYESYISGELDLKTYTHILDLLSRIYNRDLDSLNKLNPILEIEKLTPIFNNINQIGEDNHANFHDLMQKKGDVIDEYLKSEYGD